MIDPRTPVVVGVAQAVERSASPDDAPSPLSMLETTARAAAADAKDANGAGTILRSVDQLAVIRTFADSGALFRLPGWHYTNLPRSLANAIGATPSRLVYPQPGGNSPQVQINRFAEAIAAGRADICLLAGAENMRTAARAQKQGLTLDWTDEPEGPPAETPGETERPSTKAEYKHGMTLATTGYALFENALAARYGRDPVEHRDRMGELMERFSALAATNPYSISDRARTAAELIAPDGDNRYIAYPYTKYLCANMFVDQGAAVIIMAHEVADRLDIPPEKRVYLRGVAEATEKWHLSERIDFHSAPAIGVAAAAALAQAGRTVAEIDLFDLYSCFPSAVQIAADEIGLRHDDPRGLTVTGGLPYFGGPGNNYVTHAVAEMVSRLRGKPGSGLVFANGLFLTKHAFGVYSTEPPTGKWSPADPQSYGAQLDDVPSPAFDDAPNGEATIETFTIIYGRDGPRLAPLFGRLSASGARFVANIVDPQMLARMVDEPMIGRPILVEAGDPVNIARLV